MINNLMIDVLSTNCLSYRFCNKNEVQRTNFRQHNKNALIESFAEIEAVLLNNGDNAKQ